MILCIVRIHFAKSNKSDRQGRGKPCPYILATRGRKREAVSGVSGVVLLCEDGVLGDG